MTRQFVYPHQPRLHPAWPYLLATAAGIALGVGSVVLSPVLVLAALAGLAAIVVALRKPELVILAVLAISSTIFAESQIPVVEFGPGRIYATDLLLLVCVVLVLVRSLAEHRFRPVHTPLALPLFLFLLAAMVATAVRMLFFSLPVGPAIPEMRTLLYSALVFFAVTQIVRNEAQVRHLTWGVLALGASVAVAMISQYLIGARAGILAGRIEILGTQGVTYAGVTRILPPGESVLFVSFVTATALLVIDPPRRFWRAVAYWTSWSLPLAGVTLTFNRNFWISIAVVLVLLGVVVGRKVRNRLLNPGLALAFLLFLLAALPALWPQSPAAAFQTAFFGRMTSLFRPETYGSQPASSLRWRDFEYVYALPSFLRQPIFGMGLGAVYRPWLAAIDHAAFDGRGYLHNAHIWILLKTGIVGYALFAWLSVLFLARGFRRWRSMPSTYLQAITLGFTLSYLGVLLSSAVNPVLMAWYWAPVVGLLWGLNEASYAIAAQSAQRPSSSLPDRQLSGGAVTVHTTKRFA